MLDPRLEAIDDAGAVREPRQARDETVLVVSGTGFEPAAGRHDVDVPSEAVSRLKRDPLVVG